MKTMMHLHTLLTFRNVIQVLCGHFDYYNWWM